MAQQLVSAAVIGISWERVTVSLDVKLERKDGFGKGEPLYFYAVNGKYKAKAYFEQQQLENGVVRLSLNITNPGDCKNLKAGAYSVVVCDGERILARCVAAPSIIPYMEDCSRSFLHNNRNKAFIVQFAITEDEEELALVLYAMEAAKTSMNLKSNREILKNALTEPLRLIRTNIGRMRWKFLYHRYLKKYRKKQKTIMFMTEQGRTLGSNLQAVYDRMVERGLDAEYEMLTSARPASYEKQPWSSTRKLIREIAQCSTIFIDDHVPIFDWLELGRKTRLVQLWHAGAGFKSAGYSRWGHLGCPAPVSCHRQYSYGIAGSRNIGRIFSEVYGINDEQILPTGMPRMDEYLNPQYRRQKTKELYERYPLLKGKKVILFAPTYRGRKRADAHYPYEMIDFHRLYGFCGEEYVVLFKMHPWVAEPVPIEEGMGDKFVDANDYPNINDLFYITDILITDYSSNIFEFSLMRKPMLFFAFDKIQYSFSRGFHRDYEEAAPGKVCYDFGELMLALENEDYEYEKVGEYVQKHFDHVDSGACDRVIDWILLGGIPEDITEAIEEKRGRIRQMQRLDFSQMKEG